MILSSYCQVLWGEVDLAALRKKNTERLVGKNLIVAVKLSSSKQKLSIA